jgi:hypothetical protein
MKKVLTVTIIAFTCLGFISLCLGNPLTTNHAGPSSPDTNLPELTINFPTNSSVSANSTVPYSITINKPSSWFDYGTWNGQILSVAYRLDNGAEVKIAEDRFDSYESLTSKAPITLEGVLTGLTEGNHTFQVLLYAVSYYQDSNQVQGVPSNYYLGNNATATFSVNINGQSTVSPTPATPELNLSAVIVLLSITLLSFFLVRVRQKVGTLSVPKVGF